MFLLTLGAPFNDDGLLSCSEAGCCIVTSFWSSANASFFERSASSAFAALSVASFAFFSVTTRLKSLGNTYQPQIYIGRMSHKLSMNLIISIQQGNISPGIIDMSNLCS